MLAAAVTTGVALRRIQTLDPAGERLVYCSRHVVGLIEVSGTEEDLRSLAGVIADEVADEATRRPQGYLRPHLSYDGRSMSSRAISGGVVHTVPVDLRSVLIANPKVLAAWEDLTPLARNEWICWVLWPKKAETRSQHIQRLQSELLEVKRRPCCWLGCIHRKDKELSPSVRWVLSIGSKASK